MLPTVRIEPKTSNSKSNTPLSLVVKYHISISSEDKENFGNNNGNSQPGTRRIISTSTLVAVASSKRFSAHDI